MKIWAVSDIHEHQIYLDVPKDIDMVICAGDVTNNGSGLINYSAFLDFIEWYKVLNVKYKVFVAGNHDTCLERGYVNYTEIFDLNNIYYLENSGSEIGGLKLWGSPLTPSFGSGWAFNKDRSKLDAYWKHIPNDLDILITHGPPKGVLDLSYNKQGVLERCGDAALWNHIKRTKPKVNIFGHIHNCEDIVNQGIRIIDDTKFMNVSVVTDGKFGKVSSHGVVFEL